MKTAEEILYRKISVKDRNPDKYGEFNTDKGLLYWLLEYSEWSCRNDRLSEEYPMFWYEEYASQISEEEIEEEARLEANRSQFMSNFPHCWRSVYAGFLACAKWYKQQLNK